MVRSHGGLVDPPPRGDGAQAPLASLAPSRPVLQGRRVPVRLLQQPPHDSRSRRLLPRAGGAGLLLLSAWAIALAAAGRERAWIQPTPARQLGTAAQAGGSTGRGGGVTMAATATLEASASTEESDAEVARGLPRRPLMPTAEAPWLTAANQPILLSPDGLHIASFELGNIGMQLRVEAAPVFGPGDATSTMATARDIIERVTIIPSERLGIMGVRDLFWLDHRCFLITGYDGPGGRFYGWIADLRKDRATLIAMPSQESSLFVPTGVDSRPLVRRDETGGLEVLLGFLTKGNDGSSTPGWCWYGVASGDLVDAAEEEDLPTELWREAIVSQVGILEALLLVNGSVHRRTPDGWRHIGTVALAAAEGEGVLDSVQTVLQPRHLISAGPDYSVFAIDTLDPGSGPPLVTPPVEDLAVATSSAGDAGLPAEGTRVSTWVLERCSNQQLAALVHMTSQEGALPQPLFAHPFADVIAQGVWVDPQTGCPEAVMVEDLRPRTYALGHGTGKLLAALRRSLPGTVQLGEARVSTDEMEPLLRYRHGDRWLVTYLHPASFQPLVLPALVRAERIEWMGDLAIQSMGGASDARVVSLQPRVEGHRIRAGAHNVPVYLVLPVGDPAALVVRLHGGPQQRDSWGADGQDAWLASRGYGVLKVNFRGSSGFGQRWSTRVPYEDADGGFVDDVAHAVRWALNERRVLRGWAGADSARGRQPPVAVMGAYFGGYAALHALLQHHGGLFACGVAVAPVEALPRWPDDHMPTGEARQRARALRSQGGSAADPAAAVLEPAAHAQELRSLPLLVVEFERDDAAARGHLLDHLAPPGCAPQFWPGALSFVQYAGEGHGGGMIRQNGLDQYRRIDSFLHEHLSPLVLGDHLLQWEPFVDELPFISAALVSKAHGGLSESAQTIATVLGQLFLRDYPAQSSALPDLGVDSAGQSHSLVAPASRLAILEDGTVEVHVLGIRGGLHVLLSEVWLHIRAKDLGFTIALPREPLRGRKLDAFRLPGVGNYIFKVAANPNVGAVENYNGWAARGGGISILSALGPDEVAAAPVLVQMN